MTVRIASPFMFTILSLELVMHIFIQVLARKLDSQRGTVISIENQVLTKPMHRRLVINETGYFISAIIRSIVGVAGVHLISTVSKSSNLHIDNYGQLLIFCIPSFHFFVIPTILTVFSSQVRSSIPQCLKYFCQEIRWKCGEKTPIEYIISDDGCYEVTYRCQNDIALSVLLM